MSYSKNCEETFNFDIHESRVTDIQKCLSKFRVLFIIYMYIFIKLNIYILLKHKLNNLKRKIVYRLFMNHQVYRFL